MARSPHESVVGRDQVHDSREGDGKSDLVVATGGPLFGYLKSELPTGGVPEQHERAPA
jgi:hypothetical protein